MVVLSGTSGDEGGRKHMGMRGTHVGMRVAHAGMRGAHVGIVVRSEQKRPTSNTGARKS
jgi:hypothetical protein